MGARAFCNGRSGLSRGFGACSFAGLALGFLALGFLTLGFLMVLAQDIFGLIKDLFLGFGEVLAGAVDIKGQHGHSAVVGIAFLPPAFLSGVFEGMGYLYGVVLFEHAFIKIEGVAVLGDVSRPSPAAAIAPAAGVVCGPGGLVFCGGLLLRGCFFRLRRPMTPAGTYLP